MLETFFISGLVLLPLAVAVVLIAYRARYFVLGIAVIVFLMALIWAGLRLGVMLSEEPGQQVSEPASQPIACVDREGDTLLARCGL